MREIAGPVRVDVEAIGRKILHEQAFGEKFGNMVRDNRISERNNARAY